MKCYLIVVNVYVGEIPPTYISNYLKQYKDIIDGEELSNFLLAPVKMIFRPVHKLLPVFEVNEFKIDGDYIQHLSMDDKKYDIGGKSFEEIAQILKNTIDDGNSIK